MIEVPRWFSERVYRDGHAAGTDPSHAAHPMIRWQRDRIEGPFHLPEPFSGRSATLDLAFVGLNPSINGNEAIPTADPAWSIDAYDAFYRERFAEENRDGRGRAMVRDRDGSTRPVRLWNAIERLGREATGDPAFRLGTHALLLEIVRFKSTGGWLGETQQQASALLAHELRATGDLLDAIAPCVLVPMGNAPVRQLFALLGLDASIAPIGRLIGEAFEATTADGRPIVLVPVSHLSYGVPADRRARFAVALDGAIERVRGSRGEGVRAAAT